MPHDGIHPDLRRLARFLPSTAITPRTLWAIRAAESLVPGRKGVEALTLTSGRGVRLYRPGVGSPTAALLWIHGGGYVAGRPKLSDDFCLRLSRRLGITIAVPEYRLAPEHPYPAAVQDCYAALLWLADLPSVDATRLVIAGESAGGGLAAALAFMIRDRGEVSPVLQLLSYPMLDDRTVAKSSVAHLYRLWNERSNRFGWASYLRGADPAVAVPARRSDLTGLPPAWIGTGTADLFFDENVSYAQRLRAAGVPCQLEVVEGGFHGFDRVAAWTPVGRSYFDSQCEALRRAFARENAA